MLLRRLTCLLVSFLAVAGLAGCCLAPPPTAKYFRRTTSPREAFNYFRYSLETKQYDSAYECLPPKIREDYGPRKFKYGLIFIKRPNYDVSIREFVADSEPVSQEIFEADRAVVETVYDNEELDLYAEDEVYMIRVGKEWFVDLEQTLMQWNQGQQED